MLATVSLWGMITDVAEQTTGQRLADRWERARIKQSVLAKRAGVSTRTLQHLKMGQDASKDMSKSIRQVERALVEMLAEADTAEPPPNGGQLPYRRLRSVEAGVRDNEDVVGVSTREIRPGVRTMTIVLLDSDMPVDDATRDELQRILDAEQRLRPNG